MIWMLMPLLVPLEGEVVRKWGTGEAPSPLFQLTLMLLLPLLIAVVVTVIGMGPTWLKGRKDTSDSD